MTLISCFIGGGYIWLYEAISGHTSRSVASDVMAFASTSAIALPLVLVTSAMLFVILAIMVVLIREEGHLHIFLLAETGMPPFMTIDKTHKWHLLLSHVWKTGQE